MSRPIIPDCMQSNNECLIQNMPFGVPYATINTIDMEICTVHRVTKRSNFYLILLPAHTFPAPHQISNPADSINTSYLSHTACGLRVRQVE
jgi:hypothetical protein